MEIFEAFSPGRGWSWIDGTSIAFKKESANSVIPGFSRVHANFKMFAFMMSGSRRRSPVVALFSVESATLACILAAAGTGCSDAVSRNLQCVRISENGRQRAKRTSRRS
jgi:hypothetical protein